MLLEQSPNLNLRSSTKIRTPCLNPEHGSYCQGDGQLTPAQLTATLHTIDWRDSSILMRHAEYLGRRAGVPARELLHMALARALRPGTSRPKIAAVPFLTMLMKSIVTGIMRAQARARDRGLTVPFDYVAEQVPDTRSIVDPFQTLVRRDEQVFYERILGQAVAGDDELEALLDAVGCGECGRELQATLGISEQRLATLRRRLKRRVAKIVASHCLWSKIISGPAKRCRNLPPVTPSRRHDQNVTPEQVGC